MAASLPTSIELSHLQRQTLEVIIDKGTSVEGHEWREQVILRWAEGISPSDTARALNVDEDTVVFLRRRWRTSSESLIAADKKVHG